MKIATATRRRHPDPRMASLVMDGFLGSIADAGRLSGTSTTARTAAQIGVAGMLPRKVLSPDTTKTVVIHDSGNLYALIADRECGRIAQDLSAQGYESTPASLVLVLPETTVAAFDEKLNSTIGPAE